LPELQTAFALPPDLIPFIESGFLEVLTADAHRGSVEFHIPCLCSTDRRGYITSYAVHWTRPDRDGTVGPFEYASGGGQPNFLVVKDNSSLGDEIIDLETTEDLVCWLDEMRDAAIREKHEAARRFRNLA
jgi:hypothetical protein